MKLLRLPLEGVVCLLACAIPARSQEAGQPPLRLVQTISIPNVKGRLDHMEVDVRGNRLFVAGLDNGTFEVVDLRGGKWTRSIPGFKKPQGALYVPEFNKLFLASGDDGMVRVFRGDTLQLLDSILLEPGPNRIVYEPHSQLVSFAASGREALLPHREIPRDLVYSRDVAAGLIVLLDAKAPRHAVYNLSSGQVWGDTMVAWCEALKTVYPGFRFRVAAEDETPNITYSDQERSLMDMGRMSDEFGFRSREPGAVWAGFLDWVRRTPDFWKT